MHNADANVVACRMCTGTMRPWRRVPSRDALFFRCRECGVVMLDPARWPSNVREYYSEEYYPESFAGRESVMAHFVGRLPLIERFVPRGARVLEIGAASGELLHLLKERGYEVRGVELSARAARQARDLYGLDVRAGTLEDVAFEKGQFDAVLFFHVLEHMEEPRTFLAEVRRVLAPGGVAVIEVPNPTCFDASVSARYFRSVSDAPNHPFLFPPRTLRRLLSDAAFIPIYEERSPSFFVARAYHAVRGVLHMKKDTAATIAQNPAAATIPQGTVRAALRNIVGRIFPGMGITVVARKR